MWYTCAKGDHHPSNNKRDAKPVEDQPLVGNYRKLSRRGGGPVAPTIRGQAVKAIKSIFGIVRRRLVGPSSSYPFTVHTDQGRLEILTVNKMTVNNGDESFLKRGATQRILILLN